MDSLQNVLAVLCLFLITFGSVALALTLVAPALLDKPVIQWMLTGNLAPTRLNRALVSIWAILSGSYLLLLFAEQRLIGYIVLRSEEHTSELQSLMRISYAVFCLKKKKSLII